MQTRTKFIIVTVVVSVLGILLAPPGPLGSTIWPAPNHDAQPTAGQLPFFMGMGLIEAVGMGGAIAFLIYGWGPVKAAFPGRPGFARLAQVSAAWLFGNFWLHDNIHMINGMDLGGLVIIDYAFHVPIMAAGVVVAVAISRARHGVAVATAEPSSDVTPGV